MSCDSCGSFYVGCNSIEGIVGVWVWVSAGQCPGLGHPELVMSCVLRFGISRLGPFWFNSWHLKRNSWLFSVSPDFPFWYLPRLFGSDFVGIPCVKARRNVSNSTSVQGASNVPIHFKILLGKNKGAGVQDQDLCFLTSFAMVKRPLFLELMGMVINLSMGVAAELQKIICKDS